MRRPPSSRSVALALVVSLGAPACMLNHQGRADALADAVHGMVDETRWGRADLAADRVAPAFRARFVRAHAGWGERLEIADLDVSSVRMARDEESATAVLTVQWYALDTMDLATTRVRQRWVRRDGGYVLDGETILAGDARLLDLAAPPASPASDTPEAAEGAVPAAPAATGRADDAPAGAGSADDTAPAERAGNDASASAREG